MKKTKTELYEKARIPKKTKTYIVPNERSLDLDTELDFKILLPQYHKKQKTA